MGAFPPFAWIKWGILYRNTCVASLNMEVFKGEEFIFANEWLRRTCPQGLGPSLKLGQWKSRSLFLPFTKKLGETFGHNFYSMGAGIWTNQSSNVQMPEFTQEGGGKLTLSPLRVTKILSPSSPQPFLILKLSPFTGKGQLKDWQDKIKVGT